ncbi:MAG: YbaK/EbsC family protein [Halopseudomonas sp.]
MPSRQILAYLDDAQAEYRRLEHTLAYTALEVAESAHIRGLELAKVVILDIDAELAMMVIPASFRIDLDQINQSIRAFSIELADASQFRHRLKGCEAGAIPPFGNLYDMEVYIAEPLTHASTITFCAGSHTELIQMPYQQFSELVKPIVVRYGSSPIGATPARVREHTGHNF